ncbi:MAG: hypothetical protein WDZ80_06475 [Candidatus Paceibacterota bacterium]
MKIVSRDLSIHQEHELLLKLEQAGMTSDLAQRIIESKGNKIAKEFISSLNKNVITIEIESLSLLQLREKYGVGESGFYNNDWWLNEDFAKDVPEAGVYEINVECQFTNMTYNEQKKEFQKNQKDWSFPHPAVLAQAILKHYEQTGNRLLEDWYSRISLIDSNYHHVFVGHFDSHGLYVADYWVSNCYSHLGVAPFRKS